MPVPGPSEQASAALRRGELLLAFDIATTALAGGSADPRLSYQKILALARMGDAALAQAEARRLGLAEHADEDSLALTGRILKDLAFAAPPAARPALFDQASLAYLDAYHRSGGYFSAINAASLAFLGGRDGDARRLAAAVLAHPEVIAGGTYFAWATAGEALLLLGRTADAAETFARALALPDADAAARASTVRQIGALAGRIGGAALRDLADRVRPPPILFFSGHLFRAGAAREPLLAAAIAAELDSRDISVGFGALAAGADILFAEALLARGGELNVVLPFGAAEFAAQSVRPAGAAWVPRFEAALAAAHSVVCASQVSIGDPHQFAYGSEIAMGLACLRAAHLETAARHVTLWDGQEEAGAGGTGTVVDMWRGSGRQTRVIAPGEVDRSFCRMSEPPAVAAQDRESRSIIFTDYAGFSRLGEAMLPLFWREVMGRMGAVLDAHGQAILFRNTWGDALYAVIGDPATAAEVALALQESLRAFDATALGFPAGAGMRIGLHHGPLYRSVDPITHRIGYFGAEVTRTARIEPVTPVGEIYATQSFAALLALRNDPRFETRYVGHVPLAKEYGHVAMHRLTRRHAGPPASEGQAVHRIG